MRHFESTVIRRLLERARRPVLLGVLGWLLCAGTVWAADVPGVILTVDNVQIKGMIRWQPASRVYNVVDGAVAKQVPVDQAAKISVEKPKGFDAAVKGVTAGKDLDKTIPLLEQIARDYDMLQYDIPAWRWLGEAYLKTGKAAEAVKAFERVKARDEEQFQAAAVLPLYWDALIKAGQEKRATDELKTACLPGSPLAAAAWLKRGDLELKNGQYKNALVDGYLRIIVTYQNVKALQPEALYKAVQCFEELGEQAYAAKFRRTLTEGYPSDAYAKKAKTGT